MKCRHEGRLEQSRLLIAEMYCSKSNLQSTVCTDAISASFGSEDCDAGQCFSFEEFE